jgi:hypothetical protein
MKIDFEITRNGMMFKDAIHLPDDHTFTAEQIEAIKQERFERWYAYVTNPPEEVVEEVVEQAGE